MTKTSRPWKRIGLQLGILAGVGLALVGGVEPSRAAPACLEEGQCTYNKPLFLIALDYSTAMNAAFDGNSTRWERAVEAVEWIVEADNGYLQGYALLALMRFGHDPDVDQAGTTIAGDASGLVDGQKVDVSWYDELAPNKDYFHCNGQAVLSALAAMPPPLDGAPAGIGAWTAGALTRANSLFAAAVADHPQEVGPDARKQALIVITQGVWSDPENTQVLQPPAADPAPVAQDMWNNLAIPTYVMSVGDAAGKAQADALAAAGGTGQAHDGELQAFVDALKMLVQELINDIEPPICHAAMPRIMFLLDGSSSMLNVMGGSVHGAMGETPWDLLWDGGIAEAMYKGTPPLSGGSNSIETWAIVGGAVFGGDAPAEQKIVVDYAPCRHRTLDWALHPETSCEAPGCVDPWAGPPISWTFQTDEIMHPGPTTPVHSHMPRCDVDPQKPGACAGSGAFVHLGLELVRENLATYKTSCAQPNAAQTCDAQTKFYNVLIMDGTYDSDDAAVEASLTQLFADGVRTYVVGLGELAEEPEAVEQLTMMAAWGSGGALDFFAADSQVELQAALAQVLEHMYTELFAEVMVDPCCGGLNCGGLDGGEVGEPDPLPQPETETEGETEATTEATTNAGSDTSGGPATATTATTGEPTTGATSPDPSWGPTTVTPTSGPTSSPTTDGPTGGVPGESTSGDDAPTGTDSDGGAPGGDTAQEGCACTADTGASGLPAALLGLGLVGLGRRRRAR
ncbi:MYXO-CTERM sorting domain-containing protein [Nannocystis sp. SCPEA4]|uniref:MYXO-CTERM sorting domain-containing protein n=1 Tax=Nannocystis sp. SCPEA4 TaxID=2996787 RepID=UPI00226F965D|nr:MYXO-CTERM sorting domain-containing protein [Nannocystis sp. SCPEA4]MCY1055904.1 MYXO-CTERM sorting domain-containing protein [Nannocystis sp. SCPEA4]